MRLDMHFRYSASTLACISIFPECALLAAATRMTDDLEVCSVYLSQQEYISLVVSGHEKEE